ncbi:MAG: hypothetical protein A2W82_05580 [Sulfurimonas sp. RIFCSPLOWO2_12_36_12]|nr:MAG: hypothetical protein A3J26_04605 [Sulfurimonas sp. RIFCSPLOWO2_02_FULL_36_28]OHE01399.1 MAG: hypothetical protein A2W82_05580 [Sulfurimonas sp. RIFCSPLOWO2_12_36_12]
MFHFIIYINYVTILMYTFLMKKLLLLIPVAIMLNSCSQVDGANPSQNKALNSVSGKKEKEQSGFMQQSLDNWVKEDWTPRVEKDETIKKKNEDDSRNFTMQEYVDKIAIYNKEQNSTLEESHTQKVNSMPIIGKK